VNAKDIVILVCEKKAPAPYWSHTRGIYADLSEWPRHIDYYVKCPECGNVHGFYKSLADARSKRLCQNCDHDRVEKLKKEIAKVTENEQPPVPFDPDLPVNPKAEIKRYIGADWIDLAKWELSKDLGEELVFDPDHYTNKDIDPELPDDYVKVTFKAIDSDINYIVYKTEGDAEKEALEDLKNSFEDEPDTYSEWLINFIDTDKLRDTLMSDEENMIREQFEEEHSDYEDKAKAMVEAGKLDEDSFFKLNGEFRKLTPQRERLIDLAVDEWVEESAKDRLSDPVEYMKELGWGDRTETDRYTGRKIPSMFEQIKDWGALDYEKAAEQAVAADGWQHSLSRYDGKSINLPGGSVAIRE
jgi:hypothetical protein